MYERAWPCRIKPVWVLPTPNLTYASYASYESYGLLTPSLPRPPLLSIAVLGLVRFVGSSACCWSAPYYREELRVVCGFGFLRGTAKLHLLQEGKRAPSPARPIDISRSKAEAATDNWSIGRGQQEEGVAEARPYVRVRIMYVQMCRTCTVYACSLHLSYFKRVPLPVSLMSALFCPMEHAQRREGKWKEAIECSRASHRQAPSLQKPKALGRQQQQKKDHANGLETLKAGRAQRPTAERGVRLA